MTDWLGMTAKPRDPRPELRAQVLARAVRPRVRGRWVWRAAAAVFVLAALGGAGYWARQTILAVSAERDLLAAELAAVRDTLGFVRGPATRVTWVPVTTNGRLGGVTIFADSAARRWLVRCEGMAPNEPNETYQLWFVTEGGMKRAAAMTMDEAESTVMAMAFDVPADVGSVTGAAMSIERRAAADSAAPRGPMVFHLRL
ncbi:MAG TPA: anti-sigma factor [Gemmatimonadales bacterium]|nr:anti-sigma factor [Gemmatimonadales bacterium]